MSLYTYPEMVFFIALKFDVNTTISPLACSMACSSLRPTTDRGGMLQMEDDGVNHSFENLQREGEREGGTALYLLTTYCFLSYSIQSTKGQQ